jgi:hypothetical protein
MKPIRLFISSVQKEFAEERQALKAGLEANMFEFRLANHSAILFNGEVPVALTGDLLRTEEKVVLTPYLDRPEVPYTAIEPYSGQHRTCRILVTHLQGKAKGATLVMFRWIGPTLRCRIPLTGGFVPTGRRWRTSIPAAFRVGCIRASSPSVPSPRPRSWSAAQHSETCGSRNGSEQGKT